VTDSADTFEQAVRLDSVLSAYERRTAGKLVHAPVDAHVLTTIAEMFDFRKTPVAAPALYTRIQNIVKLIERLTPAQHAELVKALDADKKANHWRAMRGSQSQGLEAAVACDVLGLLGSAASGKTDLLIGIALLLARNARFIRKTSNEFSSILKRTGEICGTVAGRNLASQTWTLPAPYGFKQGGVTMEYNSLAEPDSMLRLQGRAVDCLLVDDIGSGQVPKEDINFISRWLRSSEQIQKRLVYSSNAPSSANSLWIRDAVFYPWLSPSYAGTPAVSGEVRYFLMEGDEEREVPAGTPGAESRCAVLSTIHDNPRLVHTGYIEHLQKSPTEILRQRLLFNNWSAGWTEDNAAQVIPSEWVQDAMNRWSPEPPCAMQAVGVDVARGGKDRTTLSRRHGDWFNAPQIYKGTETPDGQAVAALVLAARGPHSACFIDSTGVGSSPLDLLKEKIKISPIVFGAGTDELDITQSFGFTNLRSLLWWRFREALDPSRGRQLALPPDTLLKQELCMPHYELRGGKLFVEDRDSIIKRLKRSPDIATAFILALIESDSILNVSNSFMCALQRANAEWARRNLKTSTGA
jgi:hypothetical protein